jgi:hypothetical protein
MSAEGYAKVQALLTVAQARPAGSVKRKKKEKKEAARAAKLKGSGSK